MNCFIGLWNDDNCNENYGFICKKSVSSRQPITPAPTPLIQGGCDHGFIGVPHSEFSFTTINHYLYCFQSVVEPSDGNMTPLPFRRN